MNNKLKSLLKLILIVTCINVVLTLVVGGIFSIIWPENFFEWFIPIPVFFYITGLAMAVALELTPTIKPNSLTFTYMIARGAKILLATLFIGIYAWVVHKNVKEFGFTTLGFYIFYIVIDTWFFYIYEKRRKKNLIPHDEDVA